jgi:hypothetical protein
LSLGSLASNLAVSAFEAERRDLDLAGSRPAAFPGFRRIIIDAFPLAE